MSNNGVTLNSGLWVTQDHWNWYHSKPDTASYSHSIATMTVSLDVSTQYTNATDRHRTTAYT